MKFQRTPVLRELEQQIIHHVFERYWETRWRGEEIPKHVFKSFVAHTRRLSDSFTLDRRSFRPGYLRTNEARSSYLLYFHLASFVRVFSVLEEIHARGAWKGGDLRVLEIGAGSAPSLWATALAVKVFGGRISKAQAWDQELKILKDAGALWTRVAQSLGTHEVALETKRFDLLSDPVRPSAEKFDLIFCTNALNELVARGRGRVKPMLRSLVDSRLAPGGRFIVVEPALQTTSRMLTAFRDDFLSGSDFQTPFPCGHREPCPLNREPMDWCHFEVDWEPPPLRTRLEKALEHRGQRLKYSYLVFEKTVREAPKYSYRVLSDPIRLPRGSRLLLCTPAAKVALCFQRKESELGINLAKVRRGDLIGMDTNLLDQLKGAKRSHYAYEVNATTQMKISLPSFASSNKRAEDPS